MHAAPNGQTLCARTMKVRDGTACPYTNASMMFNGSMAGLQPARLGSIPSARTVGGIPKWKGAGLQPR